MPFWGPIIGAVASIAGDVMGSNSAKRANKTNVALQREQQKWEERMSNTAVQRHADDIEKAGGNRALAFVNGAQASTPTVQPARVEPYDYKGTKEAGMHILTAAQMAANTKKTLAEARITNVEADIREKTLNAELSRRLNRNIEEEEWDDLKTDIMRETAATTALQRKQLEQTINSIIAKVKQEVEKGDLEVKQLRNIVNVGGLSDEDQDSIMRYIIDVVFRGK